MLQITLYCIEFKNEMLTCKAPSIEMPHFWFCFLPLIFFLPLHFNQLANNIHEVPVICLSPSTGAEKGRDHMGGLGNIGATPVGFRRLRLGIHCVQNTAPYFRWLL